MEMKDKIRALRSARHMTLEEVAKIVGVGKSTVRKWENGDIANMRRDKIYKLAIALDTTPGYLMGWEEAEQNLTESDYTLEDVAYELNISMDVLRSVLSGNASPEAVEKVATVANMIAAQNRPIKIEVTAQELSLLLRYRSTTERDQKVVNTILGIDS